MNSDKMIKTFYNRLAHACDYTSMIPNVERLYKHNLADEKSYRGFHTGNLSVTNAAKYFTVSHIFKGFTDRHEVKDMLSIRLSCYLGEAIAHEFGNKIKAEFSEDEIKEFLTLDYAVMMGNL